MVGGVSGKEVGGGETVGVALKGPWRLESPGHEDDAGPASAELRLQTACGVWSGDHT